MTSIDLSDYTMPCGAAQTCRHTICAQCGTPMRSGGELITHHPGTKQHKRGGICGTCNTNNFKLIPADLQDQRHITLTDKELDHMYEVNKQMYWWTIERRMRLGLTKKGKR